MAVGVGAISMDLFVYGTLLSNELMASVCGYSHAGEAAVLRDFRCRRVRGESYPAIVPWPGDFVRGKLYRGLNRIQLDRLDRFEGHLYRRQPVQVEGAVGACRADTYVMAPGRAGLLSDDTWSLEGFLATGLEDFLAAYPGLRDAEDRGGSL